MARKRTAKEPETPGPKLTKLERAALEQRLANMLNKPRKTGSNDAFYLLWMARGSDGSDNCPQPVVWRPTDRNERRLATLFYEMTNGLGAFARPIKRGKSLRRSTDDAALIRAILANREDLTGYLVYADYLTEHDDPQGELIRLTIENHMLVDSGVLLRDARYREVTDRREQLLHEHGERIYSGLTRLGLRPEYPPGEFSPELWLDQRGVVEKVKIDRSDVLPQHAARLFGAAPFLRKLEFVRGHLPSELGSVKQLSQIEELDFSSTDLTTEGLADLLRSKHLTRLTTLVLSGNALGDAGAEVLRDWPRAATLTTLHLKDCGLTERGANALAGCPRLGGLTRLKMNGTGDTARSIFSSPHLRNLTELALGSKELSRGGVIALRTGGVQRRYPACGPVVDQRALAALSRAAFRTNLRRLELGFASFPPGAFQNFTRVELPALQVLHLNSVPLGVPEAEYLAAFRETITELTLENCGLGDAGVEALVRGTFPKLKLLDLSRNQLGTRGLIALARASKQFPSLTRLILWGNALGAEAMVQLAKSKLSVKLIELDLRGNDIRPAGAVALANTRYLNNIVTIRVDAGTVGKQGKRALGETFHEDVLEYMD